MLTIPASSAAVDLAAPCEMPIDQRGFQRFTAPGQACDAGAYEQSATGSGGEEPPPEQTPPTETPITQPPVPTPIPTQDPVPVFQQTVVAKPVSGTVRVRRPGTNQFVELAAGAAIPLGSTVDTKKGAVEIASVPKAGRAAREGDVQGRHLPDHPVARHHVADAHRAARSVLEARASAAAKKPKTRKLWGDGRGSFRTVGRYSAATVRGTKWLVQDTCAGTLTRVDGGRRARHPRAQADHPAQGQALPREGAAVTGPPHLEVAAPVAPE